MSSILISLHSMLPFELTKDTPYLALSGELWSVFYEYFNRNWSCYKGFLLYQLNHGQDKYMSSILISLHSMLPFELTKDTPYLALSGELWSVFYEYFNRNWPCYKGFLLYQLNHSQDKYISSILISLHSMLPFELTKDTPYLALSGELWSVFYEYFNRNWSCYKGFLLYWLWDLYRKSNLGTIC